MSREEGCRWGLETVISSQKQHGDLFQPQWEVRGHSLHLTRLYLPSHPPIKNWETQIPASGSGDAGRQKTRGCSCYTGPQSCRCGWCCRYCLGHQAAHCRYFYKRGCSWSSGSSKTALCPRAKSAGVASSESGQEREPGALR